MYCIFILCILYSIGVGEGSRATCVGINGMSHHIVFMMYEWTNLLQ